MTRGALGSRVTSPGGRPWSCAARPPLGGFACAVALLLAAAGPSRAAVRLGFATDTLSVLPGTTFTAEVWTREDDLAFNALDVGIVFDPAALQFVPTSPVSRQRGSLMTGACTSTFHRFSAGPDSLAATVVMLCNETTIVGVGPVYQVRFTALAGDRWTRIRLGSNTRLFLGGTYVPMGPARDLLVRVGSPPPLAVGDGTGAHAPALELSAPRPNPARAGQALELAFALAHETRMSVELLDAAGRRVAREDLGRLPGGAVRRQWRPAGLAPGRYLVRVRSEAGEQAVRSWVLLR